MFILLLLLLLFTRAKIKRQIKTRAKGKSASTGDHEGLACWFAGPATLTTSTTTTTVFVWPVCCFQASRGSIYATVNNNKLPNQSKEEARGIERKMSKRLDELNRHVHPRHCLHVLLVFFSFLSPVGFVSPINSTDNKLHCDFEPKTTASNCNNLFDLAPTMRNSIQWNHSARRAVIYSARCVASQFNCVNTFVCLPFFYLFRVITSKVIPSFENQAGPSRTPKRHGR